MMHILDTMRLLGLTLDFLEVKIGRSIHMQIEVSEDEHYELESARVNSLLASDMEDRV